MDPLVRPPIMYTLSRQVTAACMVLGFNMAVAGTQVRVTGQKHQTSSVGLWDDSATCSRIARQQLPRQPPVTKILHRNVIYFATLKRKKKICHSPKMKLLASKPARYLFCIASKTAPWWVWKHDQAFCSHISPLIGFQTVAESVRDLSVLFRFVDVNVGLRGGRPGVRVQACVPILLILSL